MESANNETSNGGLKPTFVVVNQDQETRAALASTLERRYGRDFSIESAATWEGGIELLARLRANRQSVSLIITDLLPDATTGIALLTEARRSHPGAKRVLLIDAIQNFGDAFRRAGNSHSTEAVRRAMALGHVDGWLTKPWEPADRLLFPALAELLEEWFDEVNPWQSPAVRLIGDRSPRSFESRDLLRRNDIPHSFLEAGSAEGRKLLAEVGQSSERLPIVVLMDGQVLIQPTNFEVARALGVKAKPAMDRYDLAVVGGGPAGLSAAVYGASEGLRTAVIEREAFGGQAGTSTRIRNYLGFPRGLSGLNLARRARQQAILFGADTIYDEAIGLHAVDGDRKVMLRGGNQITARAVVISTGVTYRRLGVASVERLLGSGVFYGTALSEAPALRGEEAIVVGGGNAAGQAAASLARFAKRVTLVARGETLATSMSEYLIRLLEALENVDIRLRTRVVDALGSGRLEAVKLAVDNRPPETQPAAALFVLIGTQPHTEWLSPIIRTDQAGFIVTGRELILEDSGGQHPAGREPYPFETSMPGVFAVGDVRANSVKRVASGVGEGSVAISVIHQYLGH